MAITLLAPGDPITATEANELYDALDDALRVLFNGQSPILYLGWSGSVSWQATGLCGVPFVFGTQANRVILFAEPSHNQTAIDTDVSTATLGTQNDTLQQVTVDLAEDVMDGSLIAHKRTVTTPTTADYWCRAETIAISGTQYYHHEKPHRYAVAEVVFEGHASRTFTWKEEWNKYQCIRFHNLDADAVDLVVTMESTSQTVTLPRWSCKTVRLSEDGTSWDVQGFVLFRARSEDIDQFGGTLAWNPKNDANANASYLNVWTSPGANNVASFFSIVRALDYLSHATQEEEITGGGSMLAEAYDARTGIWFTHLATASVATSGALGDASVGGTKLYRMIYHGGRMMVMTTDGSSNVTTASTSPTIDELLAGHTASNLQLTIRAGGLIADLTAISETGITELDVLPLGCNFSAHPFEIQLAGVGYPIEPPDYATEVAFQRLVGSTLSEEVVGIGTSEETDYTFLEPESSADSTGDFTPFNSTITNVLAWTFPDTTVDNTYTDFGTSTFRWDGRRGVVAVTSDNAPTSGAVFSATTLGALRASWTVEAGPDAIGLLWQSVMFRNPTNGGIWPSPTYGRKVWADDVPGNLWHPHTEDYLGTAAGDDWQAKLTTRTPRHASRVARQIDFRGSYGTIPGPVKVAEMSVAHYVATDSTEFIYDNLGTAGWWTSNRATAMGGGALTGETRPLVAYPIWAVHFNAIAHKLNEIFEIVPFSFLDCYYHGRNFRPPTSPSGPFAGHVYPIDYLCGADTGTDAEASATDLGITIRDFGTVYSGYELYTDWDVLGVDSTGTTYDAFLVANGTGYNLWNDLVLWFSPYAVMDHYDGAQYTTDGNPPDGSGDWTAGEIYDTVGGIDYQWYKADDPIAVFPDLKWINLADVASAASTLGLPFRFFRLSTQLDLKFFRPGEPTMGVRNSGGHTREQLCLVPGTTDFAMFTGPGSYWGSAGQIRVSAYADYPGTGADELHVSDADVRRMLVDPQHGLRRNVDPGITDIVWPPWPIHKSIGVDGSITDTEAYANGDWFDGECPWFAIQFYDTTPTPPTGYAEGAHRLGVLPCPLTAWGASEIESQSAPAVSAQWLEIGTDIDANTIIGGAGLWTATGGSGVWGETGAFACHIIPAGVRKT